MDKVPDKLTILKASHVVWNWVFDKKLCIPLPWGEECVHITGGISILENDGTYSVDVHCMGAHASLALFSGCHTVMTIGVVHLDICLSPEMNGGMLKAFHIKIKACLGISGFEKCWDIYDQRIVVFLLKELPEELYTPIGRLILKGDPSPDTPKYIAFEA